MKLILKFLAVSVMGVVLASVALGSWYVGRRLNYKFSYRTLVQETVREMVKQEALKP